MQTFVLLFFRVIGDLLVRHSLCSPPPLPPPSSPLRQAARADGRPVSRPQGVFDTQLGAQARRRAAGTLRNQGELLVLMQLPLRLK